MFATGIENSAPAMGIGRIRRDPMEECGHCRQWQTDFDCVTHLGIRTLRYDWEFADMTGQAGSRATSRRGTAPRRNTLTRRARVSARSLSAPDAPAASSTMAAFCWVTWSIWLIAW